MLLFSHKHIVICIDFGRIKVTKFSKISFSYCLHLKWIGIVPIHIFQKSRKGIHYFVALTYLPCKVLRNSKMGQWVYILVFTDSWDTDHITFMTEINILLFVFSCYFRLMLFLQNKWVLWDGDLELYPQ